MSWILSQSFIVGGFGGFEGFQVTDVVLIVGAFLGGDWTLVVGIGGNIENDTSEECLRLLLSIHWDCCEAAIVVPIESRDETLGSGEYRGDWPLDLDSRAWKACWAACLLLCRATRKKMRIVIKVEAIILPIIASAA